MATIDPARGVVRGISAGTAQLAVVCGTRSSIITATVTARPVVRVELSPATLSVTELDTARLSATTLDDRGVSTSAARVAWVSSDATVASVDSTGRVIANAPGVATVAATAGTSTATASVRVAARPVASVTMATSALVLPRFDAMPLSVTVRDATGRVLPGRIPAWTSSAPGVATVSTAGVVTAQSVGMSTITGTVDGRSASATVTVIPPATVVRVEVTPAVATVLAGRTVAMTATPRDSTGRGLANRTVQWSSSAPSIATVANGAVSAVAPGVAVITAAVEGVTAAATVTVLPVPVAALTISLSSSTVRIGQTVAAVAQPRDSAGAVIIGRTVAWSSSNSAVATISSAGVVTGVTEGAATITASIDGRSATANVTVTAPPVASLSLSPSTPYVLVGGSVQMEAVPYDSAGNVLTGRTIRWSTNNATIATVNAQGLVTGVALGSSSIFAEVGGLTRSVTVSVRTSGAVSQVRVTPSMITLIPSQTQRLEVTALDAFGLTVANRPVSYQSSDVTIAAVASDGTVRAVSRGSTNVTVTIDGRTTIVPITVIPTFGQPFSYVAASTSASNEQYCALLRDGRAYCAGFNWSGQLGNGSQRYSDTLVAVATTQRFTMLTVGNEHACGIATDGAAWCWGDNDYGQLGDGSTIDRLTPVKVSGALQFTQLVAASDFTCGVTTLRTALCWGWNYWRGLGVGGAVDRSIVPIPVVGDNGFLRLASNRGGTAICGVTTSQTLLCWGNSVPDGTTLVRSTPVPVGEDRQFADLVFDGSRSGCALDLSRNVWCFRDIGGSIRWRREQGTYATLFGPVGYVILCAERETGRLYCANPSDFGKEQTVQNLPAVTSMASLGFSSGLYVIDGAGRLLRWRVFGSIEGPSVLVVP